MSLAKHRWNSLIVLLLLCSPVSAENWPAWRGPQQNGVATDSSLPLRWSPTENIAWKIALPGNGTSCPIVWDGQVIVTATSGREHSELHVLSFDLTTGKPRWHRRLTGHRTPVFTQFPPLRGHAMPSPVTDGKRLVVLFSTGEVAVFDLEGQPLWFRSVQEEYGEIDNDYGLAASPVIVEDRVLLTVDHSRGSYLLALDMDSGRTDWKEPRPTIGENWTTPLVVNRNDRPIALCAGSRQLAAHDVATGKRLWSRDNLARLCCPMPIPVDDSVIVTSGPGGNVQSLQWSSDQAAAPERRWLTTKGAGFVPSAICVNGLYFYASDRGILSCLDLADGKEVWTHRGTGAFRGSPVAAGNHVYFTNLEGQTVVLDAAREYRAVGGGELGEAVSASPAISDGCFVFRTEGHLVCVTAPDASRKP